MSQTDSLKPEEQQAAEIIAGQLDGTIDPKDVGGVQGNHDFDVVLLEQRVAVEVTIGTDEDMRRLSGQASTPFTSPLLAGNWAVFLPMDPQQNLRRIRPQLVPPLAVLERHGVEMVGRFEAPPTHPEAVEAAQELRRLRVSDARRLASPDDDGDGGIIVSLSGGNGSDPDALNEVIASRLQAKHHQLGAAVADQRHLFVWVDQVDAWMAMTDLPSPPAEAPELPPEIDVVWAATAGGRVLYRLERGGIWDVM